MFFHDGWVSPLSKLISLLVGFVLVGGVLSVNELQDGLVTIGGRLGLSWRIVPFWILLIY